MGRPSNGVPYLKGGIYHIRFKGDKGSGTSLNTTNMRAATEAGKALAVKRGATMPALVKGGVPQKARVASPKPVSVIPGAGASDALGSWFDSASEFDGGEAPEVSESFGSEPDASHAPYSDMSTDMTAQPANKVGLTSEETSKLHGLLSGIVGRANVMALGLGVRIFGRIPSEPEPADMELLNRAWQLQLEELLAGKEIKPYMLIIGASVGLGVGMWAGGEPIQKKAKETPPTVVQ